MATGVFTGIGIVFLLMAHKPSRFPGLLPVAAVLMLIEGVILLTTGLKNNLPPFPSYPGAGLCLVFGTAMWFLRNETEEASNQALQETSDSAPSAESEAHEG